MDEDKMITKFPKEYITGIPEPIINSVQITRDSQNRLLFALPSKDRIMISVEPGSKIISHSSETQAGLTDNVRGEDVKVNSISIDNIADGDDYQKVKSVALNADGLVLLEETIQDSLFRTVTDDEKSGWSGAEAGIWKGDTAPENPEANDLWLDTSVTPNVLKRYVDLTTGWVQCSITSIDDLADNEYQRVKSAALTAGGLVLLDETSIGDIYSLVLKTDISAGHIILDTVEQSPTGTYGLVFRTAIEAGRIILTGGLGVTGALPDEYILSASTWSSDIADAAAAAEAAQGTADDKIETYYQATAPHPEYTDIPDNDTYDKLVGDMWYDTDTSETFRYSKTSNGANFDYTWEEQTISDSMFDTIDGKRTVFMVEPTTPYYVGDLWLTSTLAGTGDIKKCITERLTGAFNAADWVIATDYTHGADWNDDTSLINIPNTFLAPDGNGIYVSITHLGYYEDGDWTTYMDNNGNFYLGGTSGKLQWIAADDTLEITGTLHILNPNDIDGSTINNDSSWTNDATAAQALTDAAGAQSTADGEIVGFYQDEAPVSGMFFGDIWIDTNGSGFPSVDNIYRYENITGGSSGSLDWRAASTNAIGIVYLNAATAQSTADGKIFAFYQDDEPTEGESSLGDLWIDTNDDNMLYRYSGTEWQICRDAGIAQAISDAATAQSTADGKIFTFYSDDRPEALGYGDLWVDTNDNNSLHRWAGTYPYANYFGWTSNTEIIYIGTLYRPTIYNEFLFQVTTLGTTGNTEPVWDTIPGNTTNDGTVIWTCYDNWIDIKDTGIQDALDNAATAQSTADGKIVTFYQAAIPTATDAGDFWIDTDNNNKMYRATNKGDNEIGATPPEWVAIDTSWANVEDDGNKPDSNADVTGSHIALGFLNQGDMAVLDSYAYAALTGTKPPTNADHTADVVSGLAYYDAVLAAMEGESMVVGGYIKTLLISANDVVTGTLSTVGFETRSTGLRIVIPPNDGKIYFSSGVNTVGYFDHTDVAVQYYGGLEFQDAIQFQDDVVIGGGLIVTEDINIGRFLELKNMSGATAQSLDAYASNGAMYYKTDTNTIRVKLNGSWYTLTTGA